MGTQAEAPERGEVVVEVLLREDQIERLDALATKTRHRRSDLIRMAVDALGTDARLASQRGEAGGIEKAIS